jgi:hypothetical protein
MTRIEALFVLKFTFKNIWKIQNSPCTFIFLIHLEFAKIKVHQLPLRGRVSETKKPRLV